MFRNLLAAALCGEASERDGMGGAGARRISLCHRTGQGHGRPGGRCKRADVPGRPPEEVAKKKNLLTVLMWISCEKRLRLDSNLYLCKKTFSFAKRVNRGNGFNLEWMRLP